MQQSKRNKTIKLYSKQEQYNARNWRDRIQILCYFGQYMFECKINIKS